MPNLYIDDLYKNPNTKILISGPKSLEAFIVEDTFRISTSANYESKFDRQLEEAISSLPGGRLAQAANEAAKSFFGTQLKSVESTRLDWTSSEKPVFNVNIIVPAIRESQEFNTTKVIKDFGGSNLPQSNGEAGSIRPPNGYTVSERTLDTRYTIQIGQWFRASFQVLTTSEFESAKEKTPRGYPIYTIANLTFTPDRMITEKEFQDYFIL